MITSSNATFLLGITGLFPAPVRLQGFAAEDIFDSQPLQVGETSMGVDGKLSGGFVFNPTEMGISLQADSTSMFIFEQWYAQEKIARDKFPAFATILLPTLGKKWSLSRGFLINYPVLPDAKKTLQPRKFTIRWEDASPASSS